MPQTGTNVPEEKPQFMGSPMPFEQIQTPELSPALLPTFLKDQVTELAESTQTPVGMSILLVISVLSVIFQRNFEIAPYPNKDYCEPLATWHVSALEPGSRKSAVYKKMTAPIVQYELEQKNAGKDEAIETTTNNEVLEKRIVDLTRKAAAAKDRAERGSLVSEITQLKSEIKPNAVELQLFTTDTTSEQLQTLLQEQGERMAVFGAEGGIFETLAGRYSDGKIHIDVFLSGHAGDSVSVNRQSRKANLIRPALTFGLCVQPSILRELGAGSKRNLRGNGCLARFLYLVPPSNIGSRDIRDVPEIKAETAAKFKIKITNLLKSSFQRSGDPHIVELTPEAREHWIQFSEYIERNQGRDKPFSSICDWTSKLPGAVLRIAALCHLANGIPEMLDKLISEQQMLHVIEFAKTLIPHALAAFNMMGTDEAMSDAEYVLEWLTKNKEVTYHEKFNLHYVSQNQVHHLGRFKRGKRDRVIKALYVLNERHYLSGQIPVNTKGRPISAWFLNPEFKCN